MPFKMPGARSVQERWISRFGPFGFGVLGFRVEGFRGLGI